MTPPNLASFSWLLLTVNRNLTFGNRKDYYQEGDHIYSELNVEEALRKALSTWAKWVDTNVNREKSLVVFRGYSNSHFRYLVQLLG